MRAKKICSHPDCFELQPCPEHKRKAWNRTEQPDRIRGRRAVKRRRHILERDAFTCYLCGRVRLEHDLIADHVESLGEGGPDITANMRCCCVDCHAVKTQAEARRGQR